MSLFTSSHFNRFKTIWSTLHNEQWLHSATQLRTNKPPPSQIQLFHSCFIYLSLILRVVIVMEAPHIPKQEASNYSCLYQNETLLYWINSGYSQDSYTKSKTLLSPSPLTFYYKYTPSYIRVALTLKTVLLCYQIWNKPEGSDNHYHSSCYDSPPNHTSLSHIKEQNTLRHNWILTHCAQQTSDEYSTVSQPHHKETSEETAELIWNDIYQ